MMTTRYSNQQGSDFLQNPCEVQPPENIGNLCSLRVDAFGYELPFLRLEKLSVFQNLNYKLHRRLSDVLPIYHKK